MLSRVCRVMLIGVSIHWTNGVLDARTSKRRSAHSRSDEALETSSTRARQRRESVCSVWWSLCAFSTIGVIVLVLRESIGDSICIKTSMRWSGSLDESDGCMSMTSDKHTGFAAQFSGC